MVCRGRSARSSRGWRRRHARRRHRPATRRARRPACPAGAGARGPGLDCRRADGLARARDLPAADGDHDQRPGGAADARRGSPRHRPGAGDPLRHRQRRSARERRHRAAARSAAQGRARDGAGRPRLDHPRRRRPAPRRGDRQARPGGARSRERSGRRARRSRSAPAGDAQPSAQRDGSDGRWAAVRDDGVGALPREAVVSTGSGQAIRSARAANTGPGLAAGAEETVFDPFYTTKKDGMGMGLSIVRSILESHGGSIRAANHERGGAVFEFTLPLAADEHRCRSTRRGDAPIIFPNARSAANPDIFRTSLHVAGCIPRGICAHTVCSLLGHRHRARCLRCDLEIRGARRARQGRHTKSGRTAAED